MSYDRGEMNRLCERRLLPPKRLVVAVVLALGAGAAQAQEPPAPAAAPAPPPSAAPAPPLDLSLAAPAPADPLASASAEVKRVARWVVDSGDNVRLPWLVIDKVNATVYAFSPNGSLQGSAPALLGMSRGDHLLASNDAKMAAMSPQMRITPAGRFVSRLTTDSHGKELLVLDYAASISLHPVVKGTPQEHRAERLNSPTSADNRISFGCINVPAAFYSDIVSPAFTGTHGVVYVLPETGPASELFNIRPVVAATTAQPSVAPASLGATAPETGPAPEAN